MIPTVAAEFGTLYQLETKLQQMNPKHLPSDTAHQLLAPRPRHGWQPGQTPTTARSAAVLVLLYPLQNTPHILLTVRSSHLPTHAGQVSFPGGVLEDSETHTDAALREAFEEVAIPRETIQVMGSLTTLYVPASNFALHPIVGICKSCPDLQPAKTEVDRAIQVPIAELADPQNLHVGMRWRVNQTYAVPFFEVCNERVWGATAMVLAEVLTVIGLAPNDPW